MKLLFLCWNLLKVDCTDLWSGWCVAYFSKSVVFVFGVYFYQIFWILQKKIVWWLNQVFVVFHSARVEIISAYQMRRYWLLIVGYHVWVIWLVLPGAHLPELSPCLPGLILLTLPGNQTYFPDTIWLAAEEVLQRSQEILERSIFTGWKRLGWELHWRRKYGQT